ncbi:hypothetical protein PGTUg99_031541 [Puccinia graminis f. sp. tritici]|nr:hypothetical protein PGTUg99_031541 [Puccinia graminis f. sp. tritici]
MSIQEAIDGSASRFKDEKTKIKWIARHFRNEVGKNDESCASYNWFRAVIIENAREQQLPTEKASTANPFVLGVLLSAEGFLDSIENTFASSHQDTERRAKLYACRQDKKSIEEFHIIFNALAFDVDMDEGTRCEIYEKALNPKIVKMAITRGGWLEVKLLKEKQTLAILAATAVSKINMF